MIDMRRSREITEQLYGPDNQNMTEEWPYPLDDVHGFFAGGCNLVARVGFKWVIGVVDASSLSAVN